MNPVKIRTLSIHPVRKVSALLIAYALWYSMAAHVDTVRTVDIPVYYSPTDAIVDGPQSIEVYVGGTRSTIASLNAMAPMIHVDLSKLTEGTHTLSLSNSDLVLPRAVRFEGYADSTITVTKTSPQQSEEL